MGKRALVSVMAILMCIFALGQVDYNAKGLSYVANGNYEDAQAQFEAARAVLESKKVNKNSQEYIDIEKKISYAKQCLAYSKQVKQTFTQLTDSKLQDTFVQCDSESDADEKASSLLSSLDKAETALKNIRSKFPGDKVAASDLQKCSEIKNRIISFRGNFSEILAWRKASESNIMSAYESFLNEYPNGNFANSAKSRINEFKEVLAWAEASREKTYNSFSSYLSSFPNGAHANEAKRIVNELGDESYWAAMTEQGTTESYKNYIAKFPSGKYIITAKNRLAKSQERDYWEAQQAKNTVAAFNSYIKKYPKGSFVAAARNGIDKIGEAGAWEKALQVNTIEGYQTYLNSSKKKAFKNEAEAKIAAIRHEQDVNADEAVWAKIKNASVSTDFEDYLNSKVYKGHEKEARFKYNILRAREYPLDIINANEIVSALDEASKYGSLDFADKNLLTQAQELSAYGDFANAQNKNTAKSYLTSFPQGIHAFEVSNAYSKMLADEMTMNVSVDEYLDAVSYATSSQAKSYVEKKYRENVSAFKKYQRSLKVEPVHFLLGADIVFAGYPLGTIDIPEDDANYDIDLGVVASIGGHSNLFNLELGYSCRSGYLSARPRINFVKQKYLGTPGASARDNILDYSLISLYIAPEFSYFVYSFDDYSIPYFGTYIPTTNRSSEQGYDSYSSTYYDDSYYSDTKPTKYYPQFDYGIRGGIGLGGTLELFGGYRVNGKYGYIGLSWFLDCKY